MEKGVAMPFDVTVVEPRPVMALGSVVDARRRRHKGCGSAFVVVQINLVIGDVAVMSWSVTRRQGTEIRKPRWQRLVAREVGRLKDAIASGTEATLDPVAAGASFARRDKTPRHSS